MQQQQQLPSELYFIGVAAPRDPDIDRRAGGDANYTGFSYTRNNIDDFCDKYARTRARKKRPVIWTAFEHERDQPTGGKVLVLFRTDRDQLGVIGSVSSETEPGRRVIQNWMQGKQLGLSIGGMSVYDGDAGKMVVKSIEHLGLVEDPEYGAEGTWVKRFSPSPAIIAKSFVDEFLPTAKYVTDYDRQGLCQLEAPPPFVTKNLNDSVASNPTDCVLYRTQFSRQTPTQVIRVSMDTPAPAPPASAPPPAVQQQPAAPPPAVVASPPAQAPPAAAPAPAPVVQPVASQQQHTPMNIVTPADSQVQQDGRGIKRKADTQLDPKEELASLTAEAYGVSKEDAKHILEASRRLKAGGLKADDIQRLMENDQKLRKLEQEQADRKAKEEFEKTQKIRVSVFDEFADGMSEAERDQANELLNKMGPNADVDKLLSIVTAANSKKNGMNQREAQAALDRRQQLVRQMAASNDTSSSNQPHTFEPGAPAAIMNNSASSSPFNYRQQWEQRVAVPSGQGQQFVPKALEMLIQGKPVNMQFFNSLAIGAGLRPEMTNQTKVLEHYASKVTQSGSLARSNDKYAGVDGRYLPEDSLRSISLRGLRPSEFANGWFEVPFEPL